jgi:phosphoribosylformylglycinamidine synthase
MRFVATVEVQLKPGLLDPQGKAIEGSLPALGWTNVSEVRVGRSVRFQIEAEDRDAALAQVRDMAHRLLSNPVIESFEVHDVGEHAGVTFEDRVS